MAIRLGFEDDNVRFFDDEEDKSKSKEELDLYESRKKTVYIPERRIQQMKDEFDCVVVNDFGDEYHLSEEEKKEKNKFYDAFKEVMHCKKKYRRLDEFVDAVRKVYNCLLFMAENNGMYDPDYFLKLYFKDKIYITGLKFPKFIGRERKTISWTYLTEFILSDQPSSEIITEKRQEIYTNEEMIENAHKLFSEEEIEEMIINQRNEGNEKDDLLYFDIDEDDPYEKNIVLPMSEKETRKLCKNSPEFVNVLREMRREKRAEKNLSELVYDLAADDMALIEAYDKHHGIKSSSDMPEFKGNLLSDKDYHKYLAKLQEYEETEIKTYYNGRWKTEEEINELKLKSVLESNGWNIRNLYNNKEKEKKLKKLRERDKQKEKRLKEKLIAIEKRKKRRMGEDYKEEKKEKKHHKKKKNKKNKEIERYKKETKETVDEFLLGAANRMEYDFDEYKENIEDFSWDNIMKG